jgi:uncharacterized membrane protein YkgB
MPHFITILAILYIVVATIYVAHVPKEDLAFLVGILVFLVPVVVLSIVIDKFWK